MAKKCCVKIWDPELSLSAHQVQVIQTLQVIWKVGSQLQQGTTGVAHPLYKRICQEKWRATRVATPSPKKIIFIFQE